MKLNSLNDFCGLPIGLENPQKRKLQTIGYLLNYHGYTFLANEIKELANDLSALPKRNKQEIQNI